MEQIFTVHLTGLLVALAIGMMALSLVLKLRELGNTYRGYVATGKTSG